MQTIQQSIKQLERSERGQMAAKLLLDLLKADSINGLDGSNSQAVVTLAAHYLCGGGADACAVKEELQALVERNQWVLA